MGNLSQTVSYRAEAYCSHAAPVISSAVEKSPATMLPAVNGVNATSRTASLTSDRLMSTVSIPLKSQFLFLKSLPPVISSGAKRSREISGRSFHGRTLLSGGFITAA